MPGGGARAIRESGSAPSELSVSIVFLVNLLFAVVAVWLTPFPRPVPDPSAGIWTGFLLGLFGCTLSLGLLQFFVNRQREVGSFTDWNIPVSKVTLAKIVTSVGWIAGVVNCFVLAHNLASAVA